MLQKGIIVGIVLIMTSTINGEIHITDQLGQAQPLKRIVVGKDTLPSERFAAEELAKYLKQITGTDVPIAPKVVHDDRAGTIFVGYDSIPQDMTVEIVAKERASGKFQATFNAGRFKVRDLLALNRIKMDGYVIVTLDSMVFICGKGTRGTLYGVYDLLESLGCRWWTMWEQDIPKVWQLVIPCMDTWSEPDFERRELTFKIDHSEKYAHWAVKMHFNAVYPKEDSEESFYTNNTRLGGLYWRSRGGHSFGKDLMPAEKWFKEHPEYFALIPGRGRRGMKRSPSQVCFSNPDVAEIMAKDLNAYLDANPKVTSYHLSARDNDDHCQCKKCLELGNSTDRIIYLVNKVARGAWKKHPNITFQTYLYGPSWNPPKKQQLDPRVVAEFCTHWPYCHVHSVGNVNCTMNIEARAYFYGWRRLAPTMHCYAYYTVFAYGDLIPFSNYEAITQDIPWYFYRGVNGMKWQCEGECNMLIRPLDNYLIAKLLWNANADSQAISNEFIEGYYRVAAPAMQKFFDMLRSRSKLGTDQVIITYRPPWRHLLDMDVVNRGRSILEKAYQAAGDNAELVKRIDMQKMRIVYLENIIRQYHFEKNHIAHHPTLNELELLAKKYGALDWTITPFGFGKNRQGRTIRDYLEYYRSAKK